jgi:multidrug efflux system membrane fusion protein
MSMRMDSKNDNRSESLQKSPSPGPRRPMKAAAAAQPFPPGEGKNSKCNEPSPTPMVILFVASCFLAACASVKRAATVSQNIVTGVRFETVQLQSSPAVAEVVGTVQSINTSVLSAQIEGTVRAMRVKAGDRVQQGEVLALLDDRSQRAQVGMAKAGVQEAVQGLVEMDHALQAAQANLAFANVTNERYQGLFAKNSISRQEFDEARTRYRAALANERALEAKRKQVEAKAQEARSQQASAETLYSFSRIMSPLSGVVVARNVDPGTVVMPGSPLLTIEVTSRYRLEASVPEDLAGNVRLGQRLSVSLPEGAVWGRVTEIIPVADPESRTFMVKIALPPSCKCRAGEYGKAALSIGMDARLAVARTAVVERGELEGVFVANQNNVLEFRLVKTGRVTGDSVEILSGLSAGERVAVSKVDQLQDGERVM